MNRAVPFALLLTACTPSLRSSASVGVPQPAATPVASLADIADRWDIVRFDDDHPARIDNDGGRHAFVDIGADGMSFAIECNYSGMAGRIADRVLYPTAFDQAVITEMSCGSVRNARDTAFFNFFRAAPSVALLADGRLRLRNTAHVLVLERAATRRLANAPTTTELTGTWRVGSVRKYEAGGYQGWGGGAVRGSVLIGEGKMSYSRCPQVGVRFEYGADRRLAGTRSYVTPLCPTLNKVEAVLAELLRNAPTAERLPGGGLVLTDGQSAATLVGEKQFAALYPGGAEYFDP